MRTWVGVSQSVPAEFMWMVGGIAAVGCGIWFVAKAMNDASDEAKLVRLRAHQEHDISRLEAERDQIVQEAERERERQIAELEAKLASDKLHLEELLAQLAELGRAAIDQWRLELGESATDVRSNEHLVCPHCQVKGHVLVANSITGMTLARCINCDSDWTF